MGRPSVPESIEDDDEALQAALNASLQSFEDDQVRRAADDAEFPAWRCSAPGSSGSSGSSARVGTSAVSPDEAPAAKDPADLPPNLGLPKRSSAQPSAKRPRRAWVEAEDHQALALSRRALETGEAVELWRVLFGAASDEGDVDRWFKSALAFTGEGKHREEQGDVQGDRLDCPWGLRQELGGPCGVLAALQAFIVRELLWGASVEDHVDSLSTASTAAGTESEGEASQQSSQAASQPAPGNAAAVVASLAERFRRTDPQELLAVAVSHVLHAVTPASRYLWAEVVDRYDVVVREFATTQALAEWLVASDAFESSPCPVLSFVCSLVLTRGIDRVLADMDDVNAPLVAAFGHCSQELVSLCLVGRATTNVFDGDITFEDECGDAITLHGIHGSPPVGFLSALEPLKYCEVGSLLKRPKSPLWVVGSQTHYSLLFASDCRLNHADASVEAREPSEGSAESWRCSACQWGGGPCDGGSVFLYNGRDIGAVEQPKLSAVEVRPYGTVAPAILAAAGAVRMSLDAKGLDSEWTNELGLACAPLAQDSAELRSVLDRHGWERSQFQGPPDRKALLSDLSAASKERRVSSSLLKGDDDEQLFAEVLRTRWPAAEVVYFPTSAPPRLY